MTRFASHLTAAFAAIVLSFVSLHAVVTVPGVSQQAMAAVVPIIA